MKDFELDQQILGLVEPWRVESVTLKPQEREIEVRVGFADTLWLVFYSKIAPWLENLQQ
jgi:hypothetical protein